MRGRQWLIKRMANISLQKDSNDFAVACRNIYREINSNHNTIFPWNLGATQVVLNIFGVYESKYDHKHAKQSDNSIIWKLFFPPIKQSFTRRVFSSTSHSQIHIFGLLIREFHTLILMHLDEDFLDITFSFLRVKIIFMPVSQYKHPTYGAETL